MKIVIVGSGLAGVTVAEALARNPVHEVRLLTAESHGYYSRPRLSHGFGLSDEAAAKIVMKRFEALAPGVHVLPATQVEAIDRHRQQVLLAGGAVLGYELLILATGSAARVPPPLIPSRPHFFTLNSLDDLLALRRLRRERQQRGEIPRWAVIGGGLIGCELASDLRKAGDAVTILHREPRLLELQLSEPQSQALHGHFAARDVGVRYRQDVQGVVCDGPEYFVRTAHGQIGPFDGVVVSTGFAPRVELAREAGLATSRGIVVNEYLGTEDPSIHALGDVAETGGRLYPFVSPIRAQALWLAEHLDGRANAPWSPPAFTPVIKIHDFKLSAESGAVR